MRVFGELTPECDNVAQLYASGLDKKEIAQRKFRSICTINAQLQRAFSVLGVRNGRELAILLSERLTGEELRRRIGAAIMVLLVLVSMADGNQFARRATRRGRRDGMEMCSEDYKE